MAKQMAERPQGTFPSDTEINTKENCSAIILRSGNTLIEPEKKKVEINKKKEADVGESEKLGESKAGEIESTNNTISPKVSGGSKVPFPKALVKKNLEKQFSKFLDVFKKLQINIPFFEALEQMPAYAKFTKEILSRRRKLSEESEPIMLSEECSAILQRKLPPKLKDPGSFTISVDIEGLTVGKALCDLGASINLMPLTMFERLNIGNITPTMITLQLADRSIKRPHGIIEDVLVRVDKFVFPLDFVVLDMEEDTRVPLILGRPFLATGRALIDMELGIMDLRVADDFVRF